MGIISRLKTLAFGGTDPTRPPPATQSPTANAQAPEVEQPQAESSSTPAPPDYQATTNPAQQKAPPPGYGAGSYKVWPAVPHAGDYDKRVSDMDAETKSKPQKKSWLKDKLNLAGPDEKEYYDRRWGKDKQGSKYEQRDLITQIAQ